MHIRFGNLIIHMRKKGLWSSAGIAVNFGISLAVTSASPRHNFLDFVLVENINIAIQKLEALAITFFRNNRSKDENLLCS